MQERGNASLALILLPQLRDRILSEDPAVLFSADMKHVRWANASGVEMFGGDGITELLAEEFESDHPLIRQFSLAASQIGPGGSIVRGFRISRGGRTQFIQCELQKLALDGGEAGTLLTCRDERLRTNLAEHEAAANAVAALDGIAAGVAIVDLYGLTLAADEEFVRLEFTESELEHCARLAMQAEGKIAQCRLVSADSIEWRAVFACIGDRSDRFFVCMQDGADWRLRQPEPATKSTAVHEEEAVAAESAGGRENEDARGDGEIELNVESDRGAETPLSATPLKHAIGGEDEVPAEGPAESHDEPSRRPLSPIRSLLDIWYVRRGDEGPAADAARDDTGQAGEVDGTESAAASPTENVRSDLEKTDIADFSKEDTTQADNSGERDIASFTFSADADPVRFAWTIDADGIFRSVSPELAQTVGPNAADIIGRKWRAVATVFGFDRTGDIAILMEKRDTWSGKTILWPVQGTDLAVPVDLAALPVFGSTRAFDGFRGFGIVRTADAVVDPDEIGLALAGVSAPFGDADSRVQKNGNRAASDGTDDAEYAGNVVDLTSKRTNIEALDEGLSGSEAKAFAEIGRTLVESENDKGESPADEAQEAASADDATAEGPVEQDPTARISALAVPAIVFSHTELVFANGRMLDAAGHSSLAELIDAGGIEAMFSAQELKGNSRPVMVLRARDGREIPVNPWIQSIQWNGSSALLMTFTPLAETAPPEGEGGAHLSRIKELENILDTATDGILLIGGEGRIESGNASAEALFGRPLSEVVGEPLTSLFAPESHKPINDYLADLAQPGVAGILNDGREVIGMEAKGGLIPLFVTIGRNGDSPKHCVVLRDITQWKKTEEELVTARRVAETASEQKTEFLARISHEIRTPLNAIIGFSDVMIEERFGPVGNERYREYLRDINRSGVHVLDLINDLLDISKIEAGKMDLSYEAVDLNQVVSETVALLQPQANGERIIIRTSLSRAVPKVVADVRSMRQIILNLVSNAIKFTPMNGQVIVSTVYEGNGEVVLRVRDTGRGMSQTEIEHAMKPFSQINVTDERRGQGTGLGLPLTKALVEANRAYFDLESAPGEGTIAHVHFPTQRVLAD
jgi:PAS domain S-box-containing protein